LLGRAKPAKILSRYPEIYRAGDFSVSSFQFLYQGTLRLAVITSIVYPHSSVCVGYCLLVASLRRCSPNNKLRGIEIYEVYTLTRMRNRINAILVKRKSQILNSSRYFLEIVDNYTRKT
jgi:hypothetical protein